MDDAINDIASMKEDAVQIEFMEELLQERQEQLMEDLDDEELMMDVVMLTEILNEAMERHNVSINRKRAKLLSLVQKKPKLVVKSLIDLARQ